MQLNSHLANEDDRDPDIDYTDMLPIRDLSDAVVGLPAREAVKILRTRAAESRQREQQGE
jgi:hypothetical protein